MPTREFRGVDGHLREDTRRGKGQIRKPCSQAESGLFYASAARRQGQNLSGVQMLRSAGFSSGDAGELAN